MTMGVTVVTLFSILTVGVAVSAGPVNQTSQCEAGIFAVGEKVSVTCFFNTDIRQTAQEVYVTRYRFDSLENGTNALTCKRRSTKELDCKAAEGYLFNNFISDNLILEIPNANERFSGQYSCGLATHEGIPKNTCDLEIKEAVLTCQAGIFTEGTTASVTCSFHKNMENTVHHVYIVRYPFNATENSTTALICFRLHNKKLECRTEEGYSFSGIVSHNLTLKIPEVRTRFAGRYSCQIFPPDGVPLNTCDLNVEAHPRQNSNKHKDDDEGPKDIALISVSILAMLFLIAILVIAILVLCKQDSIRKFFPACFTPSQTNAGTKNEIFEFNIWSEGLHIEAREALLNNGFDTLTALKLAEEEDIKTFNLKRGHEKVLLKELESVKRRNVQPPTRELQDSAGSANYTQSSQTGSVAEIENNASGNKGGETTLPEPQRQDCVKVVPSWSGSLKKVASSHARHKDLTPATNLEDKVKAPHLFLQGIVSVSRDPKGRIISKLSDGSSLHLESASAVEIAYVDTEGKTKTFMRNHLSAEDQDVLRKKLHEFELSEFSTPTCKSSTKELEMLKEKKSLKEAESRHLKYIGVLNVKGSDTNAAAGYQEREGKQGYSLGQDLKLNQHNSDAFFHGFHKSLSPIAGIAYK